MTVEGRFRRESKRDAEGKSLWANEDDDIVGRSLWEAQVRAVPRDWCRAVRPAVGNRVVFTTKRIQTPSGRVWVLVGATRAQPTTKGVGELTGCHPTRKRASKMADPVKGRAEPEEGHRYKARGAPAVIGRRTWYRRTGSVGAGLGS